jgi:hypothetical protein
VVHDAVEQRAEALCVAERALVDAVEDGGERRVELVVRVEVCVA